MEFKTEKIEIRCTKEEKRLIKENAAQLNYPSVSRYMLDTCLSPTLFIENPSGYHKVYGEINKIGTNINQMAKHVNTYKSVTSDDLVAVKKQLKKIEIQLETLRGYRHFEKVEIDHGSY